MNKLKKGIALLVLPVVLCGCSATYNVNITKDTITEELLILDDVNVSSSLEEMSHIYPPMTVDYKEAIEDDDIANLEEGMEIYNQKIDKIKGAYQIRYEYSKFTKDTIVNSNIARAAYNNVGYLYSPKENIIQLSTNSNVKAFDEFPNLDSVTVNITTEYLVSNSNADQVNGNTYTWVITRENKNRNILLVMQFREDSSPAEESKQNSDEQTKEDENYATKEETQKQNYSSWLIIVVFLSIFAIILLVLFKIKK